MVPRREARPPWRKTKNPYRILVSEIMLQQTRVATVVPYYLRFVERYPTAYRLAVADLREMLKVWEGLGYYRRAEYLHPAARVAVADHQGKFPLEASALQKLPGGWFLHRRSSGQHRLRPERTRAGWQCRRCSQPLFVNPGDHSHGGIAQRAPRSCSRVDGLSRSGGIQPGADGTGGDGLHARRSRLLRLSAASPLQSPPGPPSGRDFDTAEASWLAAPSARRRSNLGRRETARRATSPRGMLGDM